MIRERDEPLAREGAKARVLTLARPEKKNALSRDVVEATIDAVERASTEDAVRAVVLTSEGDVFAAGGDLDEIAAALAAADGAGAVLALGHRLQRIEHAPLPILMAVNGDVYGGGCEFLLLADIVVLEAHARLSFRHARMGLAPAWGGMSRLAQRVGPTVAARMIYTAEFVDSAAAERTHLVTEVAATGAALDRCIAIANEIAKADRAAIAGDKKSLQGALAAMRGEASSAEEAAFRGLFGQPAHLAAMEAMRTRKPRTS